MSDAPKLELRHRRLHVVHEGQKYVVYERQQLAESRFGAKTYWRTFEHVIEDQTGIWAGAEIRVPPERIALSTEITDAEFEAVVARARK